MGGKYGSGAGRHTDTHTHTRRTYRKFENKPLVKGRLTVEFSGRLFQTVDSLLMVQAN